MEELNLEEVKKNENNKFCKHCGALIFKEAIICTKCGCQVEEVKSNNQPQVVINNTNTNDNRNTNTNNNRNTNTNNNMMNKGNEKNKWIALLLCLFFGVLGAHKFYEGKIVMGLIYLFTGGLFGFGWIIDCIRLFLRSNPYYV